MGGGSRLRAIGTCALLALVVPVSVDARQPRTLETEAYVPGRVIVRFADGGPHALRDCAEALTRRGAAFRGASADDSDSLDVLHRTLRVRSVRALFRRPDGTPFADQRARLRRQFRARDLAHVYGVRLGAGVPVRQAVAAYRADPHVVFAQPDYRVTADRIPDDPFFASSGAWGEPYRDLWGLLAIDAPAAWDTSLGEGVVAAVVDTGLDYDHPDIADNVWIRPGEDLNGNGRFDESDLNGIDDDGNGFVDDLRGFDFANSVDANGDGDLLDPNDLQDADPFDDNGHGTHVSGTLAAIGDNGIGISGVAPRARVLPVKGLDASGSGSISVLSQAIVYAARSGAAVVNNSWSCSTRCASNPVAEEAVRLARELDTVVVFSAGNANDDVLFSSPQNMRETITVSATNELDGRTTFSSRGLFVDVGAPGGGAPGFTIQNILSLLSVGADPGRAPLVVADEYLRLAGTSMSAPHVSGVVALVRSAHPHLDAEQVRRLLRLTADDLGDAGHDGAFGAGRLHAARAVARGSAVPDVALALTDPPRSAAVSQVEAFVDLGGTAAGTDLASYDVSAGRGLEPAEWTPIGGGVGGIVDGALATWTIADVRDGTYVLRLRGTSAAGDVETEFSLLSLERNPSSVVNSEGPGAGLMGVSGDLVAWVSQRGPPPEDDPNGAPGVNLFVSDLARGTETLIRAAPGGRAFGAMSGARMTWLDFPPPPQRDPNEIVDPNGPPPPPLPVPELSAFTCLYDRKTGDCPLVELPTVGNTVTPPDVSGDLVVWSDERNGTSDVFLCRAPRGHGACEVEPLVEVPGFAVLPTISGRRVVWMERSGGVLTLKACEIDPTTRACEPVLVQTESPIPALPELSGRLLAYQDFSGLPIRLLLCELDFETGACDAIEVSARLSDFFVSLSGTRLVWDDRETIEGDRDVFFCEYDAATRTCPVQHLTGEFSNQSVPQIDGDRVAWEDVRTGTFAVRTFELPTIAPIADRKVREGRPVLVPIYARDPAFGSVQLQAEALGASSLEALGARFFDFGNGFGLLVWRPGFDQAGRYTLRVTARTPGRLETTETFGIRVRNARRPWWWAWLTWGG